MRRLLSILVAIAVFAPSAEALAKTQKRKPGVREKHLSDEQTYRGDQKEVNFGDAQITGAAKTPPIDFVRAGEKREGYDFVKLRLRWHPEMVQSAAELTVP